MPIYYLRRPEDETREEKLTWLSEMRFRMLEFQELTPDEDGNWLRHESKDWDNLLPLFAKSTKEGKEEAAVFQLYSNGLKTGRDEWVIDWKPRLLSHKIKAFIQVYEQVRKSKDKTLDLSIKWDRELVKYLERKIRLKYVAKKIVSHAYRPYVNRVLYHEKWLNMMTYQWPRIFPTGTEENTVIALTGIGAVKPFQTLAASTIVGLDSLEKTQCLPRWRYEDGERKDNITDWALALFRDVYAVELSADELTKDDIFHYVYAALHHPEYRTQYAQNLKRDFPRIPLYANFRQWVAWGQQLMDWHVNYEQIEPYALRRYDTEWTLDRAPLPRLKAIKEDGLIELDELTTLQGIPPEAWDYKLGNRSALEWVLDQYKERKPKDPTLAAQFDTYRFADYKAEVIDLLQRVCQVSVRTQSLLAEMPTTPERRDVKGTA